MSPRERPVPPVGEEIHLPGPSLQPVFLAVGITTALLGLTINIALLIVGGVVTLAVLVLWIRDAIGEYEHLPAEHRPAAHDTVPRRQDRPHG